MLLSNASVCYKYFRQNMLRNDLVGMNLFEMNNKSKRYINSKITNLSEKMISIMTKIE